MPHRAFVVGHMCETEEGEDTKDECENILPLKELQEKNILDIFSELIVYQYTTHTILWTNKAAYEDVGATYLQLVGKHCYEVWNDRDSPCPDCPVEKTLETGTSQEGEITDPKGRVWQIKAYPLFNPKTNATFGGAEVDLYYLATELAKDPNVTVSFVVADYGQNNLEQHENVQVIKSLNFNHSALRSAP